MDIPKKMVKRHAAKTNSGDFNDHDSKKNATQGSLESVPEENPSINMVVGGMFELH
tara:strand:- start:72 stop:239 length:168 start_codon:yes stop_codon:yes gene_type:complete